MLRIGLTGGAGSGKSTVSAMLREYGAFVSQSDEIGRAMMQPGQSVYAGIVEHFGAEVLQATGLLDRAALARIAFQDGRMEELNSIVHPAVIAAQADWMDSICREHPHAVAVVESALLFETRHGSAGERTKDGVAPWRTRFDRVVLVTAPEELRLQRYLTRANASVQGADREAVERDARARFAAQMSDERKASMSDFVLGNDGSMVELQDKVRKLYETLKTESDDLYEEAM